MRKKSRKEHALLLFALTSLQLSLAFHLPFFRITPLHKEPYSLGLQSYKQATKKRRNATNFFPNELPRFFRDSTVTGNSSNITKLSNLKETTSSTNNSTSNQTKEPESASKASLPKNYEWPDPNRVLSSLNLHRKGETTRKDDSVLDELLTFVNGLNKSSTVLKEQDLLTKTIGDLLSFDGKNNKSSDLLGQDVFEMLKDSSNRTNRSSTDALLSLLPPKEEDLDDAFDKANHVLETLTSNTQSKTSTTVPHPQPMKRNMKDKNPNEYVTVKELQSILTEILEQQKMQYQQEPKIPEPATKPKTSRGMIEQSTTSSSSSSSSGVAFPQPSKLDANALKKGNTVAGVFFGFVLGISILPNLWLFGSIVGAMYGYNIVEERNVVSRFITGLGQRIAKASLSIYDSTNTLFFMYKTGQLSYQYYQKYAALDQKFSIQDKIDAFNARFSEGKIKFDQWEKENEVGRRVLAGLRTLWLVEEKQKKKSRIRKRESRYRVVQLFYDAVFFLGRAMGTMWKTLTGNSGSGLQEFVRGLSRWRDDDDDNASSVGARLGAALGAAVVVSLVGALFSLSPLFLTFLALAFGFVWPTWPLEVGDAMSAFWEDRKRRGQDMKENDQADATLLWSRDYSLQGNKDRYHFYKTLDGKKKYYRVGVPFWTPRRLVKKKQWNFFSSSEP